LHLELGRQTLARTSRVPGDALGYDGIAVPSRKNQGFSLRGVVVPSSTNKAGSYTFGRK